ncbi:hypothetical protein D3872_23140 [Massilia cavernae]|uniref:PEGA domain-containing protein n=1 Tax=Massilia cavernae TaxID=2320864 RepID=A0A418XA65_9BURK|nr:hypothetical protein D3872_23140 [Massilia cavernae]
MKQVLRSIQMQQAMQMPHRIIMPDTIVVYDDAIAELLPSNNPNPDYQPAITVDLKALASVIHYAITEEAPPREPLAGRRLPAYSTSLLAAVDSCLWGERVLRPQSIDALRDLLEEQVAPPAPPASLVSPQAQAEPEDALPPAGALARQGPRGLVLAGVAACVLAAVGYGTYQLGRQAGALEGRPQATVPAPARGVALAPAIVPGDPPATQAAARSPVPATPPSQNIDAAKPAAARAVDAGVAKAANTVTQDRSGPGTIYTLQIKPWGTVYVDGEKRGVSPPMKYLKLTNGKRTIRIENPSQRSHVITVNAGRNKWGTISHEFR